jgi:hypothetical protein
MIKNISIKCNPKCTFWCIEHCNIVNVLCQKCRAPFDACGYCLRDERISRECRSCGGFTICSKVKRPIVGNNFPGS